MGVGERVCTQFSLDCECLSKNDRSESRYGFGFLYDFRNFRVPANFSAVPLFPDISIFANSGIQDFVRYIMTFPNLWVPANLSDVPLFLEIMIFRNSHVPATFADVPFFRVSRIMKICTYIQAVEFARFLQRQRQVAQF